nr:HEPN domain-containing protein [Candidatus Freyarchaeota archaeon]
MFDPIEFLKLAEELLTYDEAKIRTAISRSYYASFLHVREVAGLGGLKMSRVHREVVRFLYRRNPFAANTLHLLRRLRNDADYDLKRVFSISEAKLSINYAKKIMSSI